MFPQDVDWKSIDPELMYKILSLPAEVEAGDRMINFTNNISNPPDHIEWFEERKFYYSQFGLFACQLSEELSIKYGIKKKQYNDWVPFDDLKEEFNKVAVKRKNRIERYNITY